ncbi:MAG: hypothetical protein M5U01_38235 [Ardenticatenaceae bacterium]|nr:hypothetical protein [Ardenticatenaceae bacterium]
MSRQQHRYLAVDGGSGAHFLAALAHADPQLQAVTSPRHADLLIVVEPVTRKLAPAVAALARALPRPVRVLVIGDSERDERCEADLAPVEDLLSGARRARPSISEVLTAARDPAPWPEVTIADGPAGEPTTISLPSKQARELATELVVLSLGPIQPVTVGPLRLLLVCDGEQVLSAQVEAGYAHRGIARAMAHTSWHAGADLARRLDPLAPIAGQLAYVRTLEQLQGWQPPAPVAQLREAALAVECAQNHLWWLVRFADVLAAASLGNRAHWLAESLAELALWERPPREWIAPQANPGAPGRAAPAALAEIADAVEAFGERVERDRLLALRTRGIGVLAAEALKAAAVSGPVLVASEMGAGDVQSRLVTRLQGVSADLRRAAHTLATTAAADNRSSAQWRVPAGEVHAAVESPRGRLGLHVVSRGGEGPATVEWQRPSAALLDLIPGMLVGQKLADAELSLASLDLAMAEADG